MTNLSPAAQAVLDAFNREARPEPHHQREAITAVLHAAADQVVPKEPWHSQLPIDHRGWYSRQRYMTRERLLAIAAELDGTQSLSGTH
jgi:D-alanyl-D-alanine dipeptidase